MTGGAGGRRILRVLRVAREAAQALMHPDRSAIVAGPYLPCRQRGVALITDGLPLVRTHPDDARALKHRRHRQVLRQDVFTGSPVPECQRRTVGLLARSAVRMYGVAGKTRHHRLGSKAVL